MPPPPPWVTCHDGDIGGMRQAIFPNVTVHDATQCKLPGALPIDGLRRRPVLKVVLSAVAVGETAGADMVGFRSVGTIRTGLAPVGHS